MRCGHTKCGSYFQSVRSETLFEAVRRCGGARLQNLCGSPDSGPLWNILRRQAHAKGSEPASSSSFSSSQPASFHCLDPSSCRQIEAHLAQRALPYELCLLSLSLSNLSLRRLLHELNREGPTGDGTSATWEAHLSHR